MPGLDHINVGSMAPGGGLNYDLAGRTVINATEIGDMESQQTYNFKHRRGILEPRAEFTPLIGPSSSSYLFKFAALHNPTGRINGLFHNVFESGNNHLMIHDKAHFWSFDGTTVTDRTGALAFGASSDDTPYSGAYTAGPASVTGGYYVFSNGAMELAYWDGAAVSADHVKNLGGFITPGVPLIGRYIVGFAGRCFLWSTVEGGNSLLQRGRWCADSNLLDWDPSSGTGAGAVDLEDTPGYITGAIATPELMAIFKSDAIVLAQETGDARTPIAFPTYLKTGCISQGSIQAIDPQNIIFLGFDDIYMLGNGGTTPIGGKIRNRILTTLAYDRIRQIVSFKIPSLSEYHIGIPTASTGYSSYAIEFFVYNWLEEKWISEYNLPYSGPATAATTTNISSTLTWTSITGNWNSGTNPETLAWSGLPVGGASAYFPVIANDYNTSDSRVNTIAASATGVENITSVGNSYIDYTNLSKEYRFSDSGEATVYGVWVESYSPYATQITITVASTSTTGGTVSQSITKAAAAGPNRLYFPFSVTGSKHTIRCTTSGSAGGPAYITALAPVMTKREDLNY
jgi:hypothetical protein